MSSNKDDGPENDAKEASTSNKFTALNASVLLVVVVVGPALCRLGNLDPPDRCLVIIVSVLLLQLLHVIPLYCTALFIPVLGTLCACFGKKMEMLETSTVLIVNVFNMISFLVMGALVISSVVSKCQIEKRFVKKLLSVVGSVDSTCFLLSLMFGTMVISSVLFSGSVLMLAAIKPLAACSTCSPVVAKRLILGIAFAANLGSMWFPISSPLNLITLSILKQFDHSVELGQWCIISIPVSCLVMLLAWLVLIVLYRPSSETTQEPDVDSAAAISNDDSAALTSMQWFYLLLGILTTMLISVFPRPFNVLLGHPAILSLAFIVATFGSGFLTREEFKQLDWDLLALVGGTNVMAFLTRETGLAEVLTERLIESDVPFEVMQFWMLLGILLFLSMLFATLLGHQLTGVVLVPLLCAIGVRFQSTELVVILCALAIPCSMGLPHVSFDNLAAMTTSLDLPRSDKALKTRDFGCSGNLVAIISGIVIISMGYTIGVEVYGPPAPLAIGQDTKYTPKELKPKEGPKEAQEVKWSDRTPDWKAFLKKPDYKAFAVGKMEKGQRTRAWGAAWGHGSQEAANEDALASCRQVARKCRIVYPPSEKNGYPKREETVPKNTAQKPESTKDDSREKDDPKDKASKKDDSKDDSKDNESKLLQAHVRGYDRRSKKGVQKLQNFELAFKM